MITHQSGKTILIYCQHLWGIGHLMRAAALARALPRHRVHLVLGGRVIGKALASPTYMVHRLPPLGCDDAVTHLIPLQPGQSLEAVQQKRRKKLIALLGAIAPDLVVVEMFPFGRPWFRFELVPMLEALHQEGTPVVCSVRDVLVRKKEPMAYAHQTLADLDQYFRAVLIHSDPALIRLEETFPAADRISIPIYYTGYVDSAAEKGFIHSRTQAPREPGSSSLARRNGLLAWTGSGALGGLVVKTILEAVRRGLLPDFETVRVYTGPYLDQTRRSHLNQLAGSTGGIVLKTFTRRLRQHLVQAKLAVCMAGYMSAVDIMATRIPAVMVPGEQGGEQMFRARKLEEAGYVRILPLAALSAHSLAQAVKETLEPREKPFTAPSLEGAPRSAKIIEAIMDGKPVAPSIVGARSISARKGAGGLD